MMVAVRPQSGERQRNGRISKLDRRWFGHDPSRWVQFRRRYKAELARKIELLGELRAIARKNTLTLVFAARDELHNEAIVLRDVLTS